MLNLPKKILALALLVSLTSFNPSPGFDSAKNILIEDSENTKAYFVPSFANCPANIANVLPNSGDCTASATWTPPTASGTGTVIVTSNYSPGDSFFPGTHQVVYRATDNSGQTAFCTFTVTVLDTVSPTITVPADITVNTDPGSCVAVVTFPYPTAIDNCPAGTGESPLEQNFDGGDDFSTLCYVFDGTSVGVAGNINGTQELETLDLVRFDTRSLLMPITRFNGTGEIFFDHRITTGTGNLIDHNSRITVSLLNSLGIATQIFTKQYVDENVHTEFIPITQTGDFSVLFEFDTDSNENDVAFLDNIYVPGFVVADETFSGSCPAAVLRVAQVPFYSGDEFLVGTTTLRYFSEDANGNISFNEFNITVLNNLTPPNGSNENYCEGSPIPELNANTASGEVVDWYDSPSGGILLHTGNTYTPTGPGSYYVQTRNPITGCVSGTRTEIILTEDPKPSPPIVVASIEYCIGDTAAQLTLNGDTRYPVEWYDQLTGGTMYATAPTPSTTTAGSTFYYVQQVNSTTLCASDRSTIEVIVYSLPAAPTVTSPVEYCIGDTAAEINDSATGSNLQWYDAAVGGNLIPGATRPDTSAVGQQFYWVTQTIASGSISCESTRARLTVNINADPVITNQPGNRSVCENGTVTFTVTASGASTYQWQMFSGGAWVDLTNTPPYSNTTANSLTITAASLPMNGNRYRVVASSAAATCSNTTSNDALLTVSPLPNAPGVTTPVTYCHNDTPVQLTATGNGLLWYNSATGGTGSATAPTPSTATVGDTSYWVSQTVTECEGPRQEIRVIVNAIPNAPGVTTPVTYCHNDVPVQLTATGSDLLWYNSATGGTGSATAPTPSTATVGDTSYWVNQADANNCERSRTEIVVTVNALPNVVANATATAINAGDPVTLTGSGANTYVWDQGVADGDTVNPLTTTTYTVIGTAANGCQNTDSVTITVAPTSDLRLEKVVDTSTPNIGATVTFTLTVTNDGPIDSAVGTIVNDVLPLGFAYAGDNGSAANGSYDNVSGDWTLPVISNGTSVSLEITATVNVPTGAAGEYSNIAQVSVAANFDPDSQPDNDDGDQSEDDEAAVVVTPQLADLEIVNTVTPDLGNPGDSVLFTVDVINNGPNDAVNVSIENIVPIGYTVTNINNGGAQTANTINWSILNIPSGANEILTFEATINVPTNSGNEYLNTVQVVSVDQFDPDSAPNNDDGDQSEDDEDNAEIELIPADLSLDKALSAASNPTPNTGDTLTFELTLTNEGPGIATNVTVEDTLPIGYTLGAVNNGGTVSGNVISWNLADVPVGARTLSYEVTLNVPTNVVSEYTNIAQITTSDQFDPDSTPNNDDGDQSEDDEASHFINPPTVDLEINKTVDKPRTFFEDTIVFTITASNNSTYEATNIGIEDVLPSGYVLVSHTSGLGAYDETTSTWEIPSIAIGATATLEMTVTVTDTDDYTNVAELIYVDQIDPNIDNDRAEVTPEVTQSECLTIFNEFSPNNDGANDFFFIECIEQYPNNLLQIFNRWGAKVFEMKGYDNSWDGISNGRATLNASKRLPVGTYYYILELGEGQTVPKSGWLYISR